MQALEELVTRWRRNPDPESTLALCAHLGTTSTHSDLMREVGNAAEAWHRDNHTVMLSVGLMFLDAGLLAEAQASMVHAAKLEPTGGEAYRHLGEVLLRRGDAERSEKVLAKALELGGNEPQTRLWHERAIVYKALQQRRGAQAVADEIARTAPRTSAKPPSSKDPLDLEPGVRAPRARAEVRRSRPPPAAARPSPPRRSSSPTVGRRQGNKPAATPPQPTLLMGQYTAPGLPTGIALAPSPDPVREVLVKNGARVPLAPLLDEELDDAWEPPREAALDTAEDLTEDVADEDAADSAEVNPAPETVLAHLARVGLFEPETAGVLVWEAAPHKLPRRLWVLAGAVVGAVALGLGGYQYARGIQSERAAEARRLETDIAAALTSGHPEVLQTTDATFRRLFDLDSRGKTVAKLWLSDRVLRTLLGDSSAQGLESAIQRARSVGVDEAELIFGSLASSVAEGDLPGAARLIERWDERAKADAQYQLLAGVVFERAGDERALQRFQQALELDGKLQLAHVMAATLASLELEPEGAQPILDAAYAALGEGHATRALRRLAWARAFGTGDTAPTALEPNERAALLPPLRSAEVAVTALSLSRAGKREEAARGFNEATGLATSPALATWIGYRALEAGHPSVARAAALRALQLSALYPRAQALATRVALSEGRLVDAERAAASLGPMATEPLLIRAASAYENFDSAELGKQLASLPSGFESSPTLGALGQAQKVLLGKGALKRQTVDNIASERQIWGPMIALDAALDAGNIKLAQSLVAAREQQSSVPAQALRLARLARYEGDYPRALELAKPVLAAAANNRRYLAESVLLLVDAGRADAAAGLLTEYAPGAGELAPWLLALVDAARGEQAAAVARIGKLPLPAAGSGALVEVTALRALAASKDKRTKAALKTLQARLPRHPDVDRAAR